MATGDRLLDTRFTLSANGNVLVALSTQHRLTAYDLTNRRRVDLGEIVSTYAIPHLVPNPVSYCCMLADYG